MSDREVADFLDSQRVVTCASNGRGGFPHLMPLWYVLRGEDVWSWTYAKSQKVRNIERDDRVTLQVESGIAYEELRGVMIRTRCAIHREVDDVAALGEEIFRRYMRDYGAVGDDFLEAVRAQAPKRVGLQFRPQDIVSWDHRKLGGTY